MLLHVPANFDSITEKPPATVSVPVQSPSATTKITNAKNTTATAAVTTTATTAAVTNNSKRREPRRGKPQYRLAKLQIKRS